jgi:hypothetical protein
VELGAWDVVVLEECQQGLSHSLNGRFDAEFGEVHVRKPHMSLVPKVCRRNRECLKGTAEVAVCVRELV